MWSGLQHVFHVLFHASALENGRQRTADNARFAMYRSFCLSLRNNIIKREEEWGDICYSESTRQRTKVIARDINGQGQM